MYSNSNDRDLSFLSSGQFGGDIREYAVSLDFQRLADAINLLGRGEYEEADNLITRMPHIGPVEKVCLEIEVSHGEELSLAEGVRVRFDGLTIGSATTYIDHFPVTAQDVRVALLCSANAQYDYHLDFVV